MDSESQYEAQYYAEGDQIEDAGFLGSSQLSETDREQFVNEHVRYADEKKTSPFDVSPLAAQSLQRGSQVRIKALPIPRMKVLLVAVGTR